MIDDDFPFGLDMELSPSRQEGAELARRIAEGDEDAMAEIAASSGSRLRNEPFPIFPKHTLRINIAAAGRADPERREIVRQ